VDERLQYGGQAVVEGVMMRSPRYFAVACRRGSDQKILVEREPVERSLRAVQWLNRPFLRGTFALIDSMALGIKALTYAANVQIVDEQETGNASSAPQTKAELSISSVPPLPLAGEGPGEGAPAPRISGGSQTVNGITIGATAVLALVIGFALFWTLPAFLTDHFVFRHVAHAHSLSTRLYANLVEGGIRLAFFFAYVALISGRKHVQRVFQYHGAEHKAINTLEAGLPLTLENARASSRIHPRCGTNFIFIVLITSIIVFSVIPRHTLSEGIGPALSTVGLRILLLPVVAGIAFEILKWAGSNRDKRWAQALIAPGLWTQYMTTRIPDDSQIEVAIAALESVWQIEHATAPPQPLAETGEPAAAVA
jgi:uncharacterized protein YqhQ